MNVFYGLIGLGCAFTIVKYRGALGDMIGRVDWAEKWIGSTYNLIVLVGVGIALLSLFMIFGIIDFTAQDLQVQVG